MTPRKGNYYDNFSDENGEIFQNLKIEKNSFNVIVTILIVSSL